MFCLTQSYATPIIVLGGTTLIIDGSHPAPLGYEDGFEVRAGGHLIIDYMDGYLFGSSGHTMKFNTNAKILIKKGGHARIVRSVLEQNSANPDDIWVGIVVEGDATKEQYHRAPLIPPVGTSTVSEWEGAINDTEMGWVELFDSTIINAQIGIESNDGGIIESFARRSSLNWPRFHNCRIGIEINYSDQVPSATRINSCDFIWDTPSKFASTYVGFVHIQLNASEGMYFGGCLFENSDIIKYDGPERGTGIATDGYGCSFNVGEGGDALCSGTNHCRVIKFTGEELLTWKSNFNNLTTAIDAQSTGKVSSLADVSVSNSDFTNNLHGFFSYGGLLTIHNCSFVFNDDELDIIFLQTTAVDKYHFDLQSVKELLVYTNHFECSNFNPTTPWAIPFMTRVTTHPMSGTVGKILFQNNTFDGSTDFIINTPTCIHASGNLLNFEWTCNTFENFDKAVKYSGSGPKNNPNMKLTPANNTYTNIATYKIENSTTTTLAYKVPLFGSVPSPSNGPIIPAPRSGEAVCTIDCKDLETIRNDLELSIWDLKYQNFKIYPNPSTGSFTMPIDKLNLDKSATVSIVNAIGMEVKTWEDLNKNIFEVSDLPNGLYLLKIQSSNSLFSTKLIIQK